MEEGNIEAIEDVDVSTLRKYEDEEENYYGL